MTARTKSPERQPLESRTLVPIKIFKIHNWQLLSLVSNFSLVNLKFRSSVFSTQRLSFFGGHLPLKIIFFWWMSSIDRRLPSKVVLHQRLYLFKSCLQSIVHCNKRSSHHQRLSSINGCPPSNFIFKWRVSPIKGYLQSKDVFRSNLASFTSLLPLKVIVSSGPPPPGYG